MANQDDRGRSLLEQCRHELLNVSGNHIQYAKRGGDKYSQALYTNHLHMSCLRNEVTITSYHVDQTHSLIRCIAPHLGNRSAQLCHAGATGLDTVGAILVWVVPHRNLEWYRRLISTGLYAQYSQIQKPSLHLDGTQVSWFCLVNDQTRTQTGVGLVYHCSRVPPSQMSLHRVVGKTECTP